MGGREIFLNHDNNMDDKIIQGVEVHSGKISHVKPIIFIFLRLRLCCHVSDNLNTRFYSTTFG